MYWAEFAKLLGLRPHDHILEDASLPEYERRMKHAKLLSADKDLQRLAKQPSLGPDYRPLSPVTRLYLKYWYSRRHFKRSKLGRLWFSGMSRIWLGRLWVSKQIQYRKYVSLTGYRKLVYLVVFGKGYAAFGLCWGEFKSYMELFPGHTSMAKQLLMYPSYHWITGYILEDTYFKMKPDSYKKDNLAQALDRVLKEGIENGEMDSLNWLLLGSLFTAQQEEEFGYLSFQMAHFKNHKVIGGNSLQPIETSVAIKFFGK